MKDRMLKVLLSIIAVALWAVVLRPLWTLTPAQAQGEAARAATYKYWIAINDDPDKMEETLNQYGAGGWRAAGFCVLPLDGFRQSQMLVLFEKSAD